MKLLGKVLGRIGSFLTGSQDGDNRPPVSPSPSVSSQPTPPITEAHPEPSVPETSPPPIEKSAEVVTVPSTLEVVEERSEVQYKTLSSSPSNRWSVEIKQAAVNGESVDSSLYCLNDNETGARLQLTSLPPIVTIGPVSESGAFCVWYEHLGQDKQWQINVYSHTGTQIYTKKTKSCIFNAGISSAGKLLAFQTAISPSDDSNHLTFVDLRGGGDIFSLPPKTRWADSYDFEEEAKILVVALDTVGTFRYTPDGQCIDLKFFNDPALDSNTFSVIIPAAEAMISDGVLTREDALRVLNSVVRARALGADRDVSWNPIALKVQGLALESLGEYRRALECLLMATELKPRIGVKRKIDSLRQKLGIAKE